MILLFDIGNTNTHVGLANDRRVLRQTNIPTAGWFGGPATTRLRRFVGQSPIEGAALCSVVPRATPRVKRDVRESYKLPCLELTPRTLRGLGIDYPKPDSIGPDRLANAVAARQQFGAPVVVLDFGTAVTFDVVDQHGNYVGGIIAPGLAAMTDYLHDKTALLPRITIREFKRAIGARLAQLGARVALMYPQLARGRGVALLMASYGLMLGLWQIADPPECLAASMALPEMRVFRIDFETQLGTALMNLWEGATQRATQQVRHR